MATEYDADFRPWKERVNGGHEVVYGYDADGLLVSAGPLAIHRRADNGLVGNGNRERWDNGTLLPGRHRDGDARPPSAVAAPGNA